jgi:hypothetical protein
MQVAKLSAGLMVLTVTACGGPDSEVLQTLRGENVATDPATGAVMLRVGDSLEVRGLLVYDGRRAFAATVMTSNRPDVLAVQRIGGDSFHLEARTIGDAELDLSYSADGKGQLLVHIAPPTGQIQPEQSPAPAARSNR